MKTEALICPSCGNGETVAAKSILEGSVYLVNALNEGKPHEMVHSVCTGCGCILRSIVQKKTLCSCRLCNNGQGNYCIT